MPTAPPTGAHHGALEIDPGEVARGFGLRHGGDGRVALRGKDGEALLLGLDRRRGGRYARLRFQARRVAFIQVGLADGVAADQLTAAVVGLGRERHLGHGRPSLGVGLPDQDMLKPGLRIDVGKPGLGRLDIGHRLGKPRAIIAIVDPEQDIVGSDGLVVGDLDGGDVAGDLGCERGQVAADIGVVGRRPAV
nr:hypothetical protein [Azospirillum baldaniorum]